MADQEDERSSYAPCFAIYINAGHDRNGNPRRGWMIVNTLGATMDFVDEGYSGYAALRATYPELEHTSSNMRSLHVTPGEYRRLMKHRKEAQHA